MQNFKLILVLFLACCCVGCVGGGDGGGAVPYTAEVEEIKPAYTAMKVAMEDNASDPTARTNAVMGNVAAEFVDNAGTPSYNELRSTTLSRLQRYTVNDYEPTIGGSVKLEEGLISVSTSIYLSVTLKEGQAGTAGTTAVTMTSDVQWKKGNDGVWKIVKGLPYKR